MADDSSEREAQRGAARFPPTRRSAIAAVGSDDPAERARSFDILVRAYWKPVYAHVRVKWNRSTDDARDLTQGFFARAFEKRYFADYDPAKALFRTYLKTCLDRFVMEAARGERREKRGGGAVRLSLDFDVAEDELRRLGPRNPEDVDACFDAEWTRSLLAAAVDALEVVCTEKGKEAYFAVFRRYVLDGDGAASDGKARPSYAAVAAELGLTASDVTNYLSWARREFRRVILEKLREITATEDELRAEARALIGDTT